MVKHDAYDMDILKALRKIGNTLEKIERKMPDKPIVSINEMRNEIGLDDVTDFKEVKNKTCPRKGELCNEFSCGFERDGFCGEIPKM